MDLGTGRLEGLQASQATCEARGSGDDVNGWR